MQSKPILFSSLLLSPGKDSQKSRAGRRMLSLQCMVNTVWREFVNRKLDFLWAGLSLGMAVFTWPFAIRAPYAPIWLYVLLDLQCAVIFARLYGRHPLSTDSRCILSRQ
jgi:hypothetical protein